MEKPLPKPKKRKTVSFTIEPRPEVSARNHGLNPPVLIQGLSADKEEIVVDWSSGTEKPNISSCTDDFVEKVVEKSRAELRAQEQADDLLGKFPFFTSTSEPPMLESVRIESYQSTECK